MNFNTDGFNERTNYIRNSNDINRLNKNGPSNFDNSFAKMRVEENKNLVKTVNTDSTILKEEARGNIDNFVLRQNNMRNANKTINNNNPVSDALNKNRFNIFNKN